MTRRGACSTPADTSCDHIVITLAIDASTYTGDVAVLHDGRVLAEERTAMKDAEHERLMPAVASVLERAGKTVQELGRVVCGAGPGSFTSLRIAGSIAKGIAAGAIPLYAVPSMALIVGGASWHGAISAAVDALRGEFYVGLTMSASGEVLEFGARLVPPTVDGASRGSRARVGIADPRAARVLSSMAGSRHRPGRSRSWEPQYGRLAAQVKWEAAHGRPLAPGERRDSAATRPTCRRSWRSQERSASWSAQSFRDASPLGAVLRVRAADTPRWRGGGRGLSCGLVRSG